MPCYKPLMAVDVGTRENGKKVLKFLKGQTFDALKHTDERIIPINCGQCIGCRLERSKQWATRCVFEANFHDHNCFITLTFNDKHLNVNQTLVKRDFQLFMKRLRKLIDTKKYDPKTNTYVKRDIPLSKQKIQHTIKYFHCGEYGSKGQRPHHHACLFNFDFEDKKLWQVRDGIRLYRSAQLEETWPYGFCTIGQVTFQSAAYIARYVMKKWNKDNLSKEELYNEMLNSKDAHYQGRLPEYISMSKGRRTKEKKSRGIGAEWFYKYKDTDIYNWDQIILSNGVKLKSPRYYDKIFDEIDPVRYSIIKEERIKKAKQNPDKGLLRLKVKEKIKLSQIKKLRREYETSSI